MIKFKADIDGYEYEIKRVNPLSIELNGGEYLGRIDYTTQTIFINETLSGVKEKEVLIHELTHAYLNRHKHQYEQYMEEDVCHMFELYAEKIIKLFENINENKENGND